jgi:hypothetical protein
MAHGHKTAGTPNKLTANLKSRIAALLDTQFDTVIEDLDALEPMDMEQRKRTILIGISTVAIVIFGVVPHS